MSRTSYDQYGARARELADPIQATARPRMTRERERRIVPDIARKMELGPTDRLLDIGCGIGTLTIPLSFLVSDTLAVDHPDCIARLRAMLPTMPVRTLAGNWLDVEIKESFSKILMYSTVHYLSSIEEVGRFIDKALRLLESRGLCLIGDLPNEDTHRRFETSPHGQAYAREWESHRTQAVETVPVPSADSIILKGDPELVKVDDRMVLELCGSIRKAGYQCWILPQPDELPFGPWRDDLLVRRP